MDWYSHNFLVEQHKDYFQCQNDVENGISFSDIGLNWNKDDADHILFISKHIYHEESSGIYWSKVADGLSLSDAIKSVYFEFNSDRVRAVSTADTLKKQWPNRLYRLLNFLDRTDFSCLCNRRTQLLIAQFLHISLKKCGYDILQSIYRHYRVNIYNKHSTSNMWLFTPVFKLTNTLSM